MNPGGAVERAQAHYAGLDPHELAAVAGSCALSLEDVQQEAWIWCWRIAAGRSDHDPAQGSVRQYVMGRLWGLARRWPVSVRLGGEEEEGGESRPPGDAPWERALLEMSPFAPDPEASDPITVLMAREQAQSCAVAIQRKLTDWLEAKQITEGERTFLELVLAGAPVEEIAMLYGLTPRAVRYRCDRLIERLDHGSGSIPTPRPAATDRDTAHEGSDRIP